MPDSAPDLAAALANTGADPAYIARLFAIESGGDPGAVTGSNRGLGQFGPSEEARYGLSDANRTDPQAQATAVSREAQEHTAALRSALGRDPTPGELYLTHQQGIAGGPALLNASPDMPAWQAIRPYYKNDAIAQKAITGNIPRDHALYGKDADSITADAFRSLWVNKFEGGLGNKTAGGAMPASPVTDGGVPVASSPDNAGILNNPTPTTDPHLENLIARAKAMMGPTQMQVPPLPPIATALPKGLNRARLVAAITRAP